LTAQRKPRHASHMAGFDPVVFGLVRRQINLCDPRGCPYVRIVVASIEKEQRGRCWENKLARCGQAFKDRVVARPLPAESAALQDVSREVGVSVGGLSALVQPDGNGASTGNAQERRRIGELERELCRKDKALAETTALSVLSKKSRGYSTRARTHDRPRRSPNASSKDRHRAQGRCTATPGLQNRRHRREHLATLQGRARTDCR
jgi:hypothetical protein